MLDAPAIGDLVDEPEPVAAAGRAGRADLRERAGAARIAHGHAHAVVGLGDEQLDRLAEDPELATIVLDMRGLEFMDSSGLRLVVVADMRAREAGRRFSLVRGDETVHRVFEITRMSERLDFVDAPEDVQ